MTDNSDATLSLRGGSLIMQPDAPTIPVDIAGLIDTLTKSAIWVGSASQRTDAERKLKEQEAGLTIAVAALSARISAIVAERDALRKAVTTIDDAFDVLEKTGNPVELRATIDEALALVPVVTP